MMWSCSALPSGAMRAFLVSLLLHAANLEVCSSDDVSLLQTRLVTDATEHGRRQSERAAASKTGVYEAISAIASRHVYTEAERDKQLEEEVLRELHRPTETASAADKAEQEAERAVAAALSELQAATQDVRKTALAVHRARVEVKEAAGEAEQARLALKQSATRSNLTDF
eukprot:gnl/TRDRNA2_/TRDRNA2_186127_c0_seq1.p1 gnl/TRDRNA2_/TRDRNA2_186127_c0~~gnl/TRDRNA2_/TRDRNA2_186127_c0_seq1.p1  ORF type:complete len:170 (+),score=40.73 gnl/TRDRNA2_/TRDRNA2_186127_c0_seq1:129-638(+)